MGMFCEKTCFEHAMQGLAIRILYVNVIWVSRGLIVKLIALHNHSSCEIAGPEMRQMRN